MPDAEFTRHLAGVQTREQSDAAFDRWQRHWEERWLRPAGGRVAESGELIGRIGAAVHRMWPDDPEVGWALDPPGGAGVSRPRQAAAVVAWSFGELGFERVVSITTEANTASREVMAKLGFTLHAQIPSEWGLLWIHVARPVAGRARRRLQRPARPRAGRRTWADGDPLDSLSTCLATGPSVLRSWAPPSSAPPLPATPRVAPAPSSAGSSWAASCCSRSS